MFADISLQMALVVPQGDGQTGVEVVRHLRGITSRGVGGVVEHASPPPSSAIGVI